ncbi:hypothetical protein RZS08_23440, partial [Arthrospira platensis SPKY1]|nr:hypothetical protein [Arthrospira platensis SPKY1]
MLAITESSLSVLTHGFVKVSSLKPTAHMKNYIYRSIVFFLGLAFPFAAMAQGKMNGRFDPDYSPAYKNGGFVLGLDNGHLIVHNG